MTNKIDGLARIFTVEDTAAALELARANDNSAASALPMREQHMMSLLVLITYMAEQTGISAPEFQAALLLQYGVERLGDLRDVDYEGAVRWLCGEGEC